MAISCNNCGYAYNPDDANQCEICGAPIQRSEDRHDVQGEMALANHSPATGYISHPSVSRPHPSGQPRPAEPTGVPPAGQSPSIPSSENTIYGKISHIERHDERPRTDVYRVLARILISILVFIPYAVFFVVFGLLSFAFAFLGFSGLSQLLNPLIWTTSLFEFLEVIVLRRIHRTDVFPVYRGLIEDQTGRENTFVFRGPLALGNLVEGHKAIFAVQRDILFFCGCQHRYDPGIDRKKGPFCYY